MLNTTTAESKLKAQPSSPSLQSLDLAMIGNGSFAALIDQMGTINWACLPNFDSDPIFCNLIDGGTKKKNKRDGIFAIILEDFEHAEQYYVENSAIVITTLHDHAGNILKITDFAPRFFQYDRTYRPTMIVRHIEPLSGSPKVTIKLRPKYGYGSGTPETTRGSNHMRFVMPDYVQRLTTDVPITLISKEKSFLVEKHYTLLFGPDESLQAPVAEMGRQLYHSTLKYWKDFTRALTIPFEWQDAVIRAAITLKLCTFDETGAVLAAVTTSIPESPPSPKEDGRNWDYRFCWLRDSFFVVHALNRLGATTTMENYLAYISNIVGISKDGPLQPVFGISYDTELHETKAKNLSGYRGIGPVRVGNQAYDQIQNDGYGAVILASAQSFFDRRIAHTQDSKLDLFYQLELVGEKAAYYHDKPDAGLWELRNSTHVHTFSAAMCWAACDRLARIAASLNLTTRQNYWTEKASKIHTLIWEKAWNEKQQSFVESFDGVDLDASLLLLHDIGFIKPTHDRFIKTVEAIEKNLKKDGILYRYIKKDDFGEPETAFTICTFWYIDALHAIGRKKEARALFEKMLGYRNHVGLLSEDIDFTTGELWGNFPQTYSMVGLINSAMRLSKSWEDVF